MFLQQPEPTSADLRFRLLRRRCACASFFLAHGCHSRLGLPERRVWPSGHLDYLRFRIDPGIHELGHVFMGRLFGTDSHIVLHGFGGLAIGSNNLSNP